MYFLEVGRARHLKKKETSKDNVALKRKLTTAGLCPGNLRGSPDIVACGDCVPKNILKNCNSALLIVELLTNKRSASKDLFLLRSLQDFLLYGQSTSTDFYFLSFYFEEVKLCQFHEKIHV